MAKYQEVFDFPVYDYYLKLGFRFDQESFESISERFHELYHAALDEARVFPGTLELIRELPHEHFVLSAAQQGDLNTMLEKFGLKPHFKAVYGLNDRLAKSKVERGLTLIREQALNPADCLMIGDTLHDLEVGTAMGVEVLLLTGGHHHETRLRRHHRVHTRNR